VRVTERQPQSMASGGTSPTGPRRPLPTPVLVARGGQGGAGLSQSAGGCVRHLRNESFIPAMHKTNPFQPNNPVHPDIFAGRIAELEALEAALLQTRAAHPKSIMVTGERGIGKTSLLEYLRLVAQGRIDLHGAKLNFLVVSSDISSGTTQLGLVARVKRELERQLAKSEAARSFLKTAWEVVSRSEGGGIKLGTSPELHPEVLPDEFAASLAETAARISDPNGSVFGARYDGIVLMFDEADKAADVLDLGAFLKLLVERLQRRDCLNVSVVLAGLPELREVLLKSHASSLRIFDELKLGRLKLDDVKRVIRNGIERANQSNVRQTQIEDGACEALARLSEGYPHFIQQFAYSAFQGDTDDLISEDDVWDTALAANGALELIGDRYYRDDYYSKIQTDSYRQVLRVMADNMDNWTTKAAIRAKFSGKEHTLTNALQALRERKIILSKEGEPGVYRLQHKGFALWIRLYTTDPEQMQRELKLGDA
jgi:hypothetical protein